MRSEEQCGAETNPDDDDDDGGGGGGNCGARGMWFVLGGRVLMPVLLLILWLPVLGGRCVVLVLLCFSVERSVGTFLCLPAEGAFCIRSSDRRVLFIVPLVWLFGGRGVVLV